MSENIQTEVRRIGPKQAQALLSKNAGYQRKLNTHIVRRMIEDMKEGRWEFTAEPIKLTDSGQLMDGQHRLQAVVQSGVTLDFLVVSGLTREAYDVEGTGRPKSVSDVLTAEGWTNTAACAACATKVAIYQKHSRFVVGPYQLPSRKEVLQICRENREAISRSAHRGVKPGRIVGHSSQLAAFDYVVSPAVGEEFVNTFFDGLETGADLGSESAIYRFREIAIRSRTGNHKIEPLVFNALLFIAWNKWMAGAEVRSLQWRRNGPAGQAFPQLDLGDDSLDLYS